MKRKIFHLPPLGYVSRDAMITVAVSSLTSFASGFVIFMFLVDEKQVFLFNKSRFFSPGLYE